MQFTIITAAIAQAKSIVYTCVMHPEIIAKKPGTCPKCAMNLIKKRIRVVNQKEGQSKPTGKANGQRTAPAKKEDFPDMKSDTTYQQRPNSGEELLKAVYTCPMHPEIQKDKPGKCPECGMFLVRKTVSKNNTADEKKNHNLVKLICRKYK